MNYQILFYLLGWVMRFQAVFMLLPAGVAFYAGEPIKWHFLVASLVVGVLGGLLAMKKPENTKFRGREGFTLVAISWMLISAISAIPLSTSGAIPNYVDALFEMVSGFTTTGASILSAPESMPRIRLFFRSAGSTSIHCADASHTEKEPMVEMIAATTSFIFDANAMPITIKPRL